MRDDRSFRTSPDGGTAHRRRLQSRGHYGAQSERVSGLGEKGARAKKKSVIAPFAVDAALPRRHHVQMGRRFDSTATKQMPL